MNHYQDIHIHCCHLTRIIEKSAQETLSIFNDSLKETNKDISLNADEKKEFIQEQEGINEDMILQNTLLIFLNLACERLLCPSCMNFPSKIKDPIYREKITNKMKILVENFRMADLKQKLDEEHK